MNTIDEAVSRPRRVQRALMVWSALILFVLGVWLLMGPFKAHAAEKVDKVDNVVAAGEYPVAALGRQPVRLAD